MDNNTPKLNKETWDQAKSIFVQAITLPPVEVDRYLQEVCAGNADLLQILSEMVEVHHNSQEQTLSPQQPLSDIILNRQEIHEDTVIGQFRIIELISKGGMGDVYLAERHDEAVQQRVAIKAVPMEQLDDASLKRFELERQVLARLEHPNIARLIDVGEANGYLYCAMEFVDGLPITDYCRQKQLHVHDRLRLFLDVCEAVHYAHINLIVHRDLKPNNILVTNDGVVKLLDFGIAKPLHQLPGTEVIHQTVEGASVMTPQYAAPEQFSNQNISTACDIYTLGLLLYELITERSPYDFEGKSWGQIEKMVMEDIPLSPSRMVIKNPPVLSHFGMHDSTSLANVLRGDVDAVVMHALKKLPHERYASCLELSQDLNHHLHDLPISVKKSEKLYRFKKYCKRNWFSLSVAGIALSLLVAASVVVFQQARIARQERDIAIQEKELSDQTRQFLTDIFNAADRTKKTGEVPSVTDVLEAGLEELNTIELTDEVKNRLKTVIAGVYWNMGRFRDVEKLVEQIDLGAESLQDIDKARMYRYRALILMQKHGTENLLEAAELLKKAESYAHSDIGFLIEIIISIADAYGAVEARDDALAYLDKAAVLAEQLDKGSLDYAVYLQRHTEETMEYDLDENKMDNFFKVLEIRKKKLGPDHVKVAETLQRIANFYIFSFEKHELALGYVEEMERIFIKTYGDDYPKKPPVLNTKASIYKALGEHEKAIQAYQEALDFETTKGSNSPRRISILTFNTGVIYSENLQNYDEAIKYYLKAMEIVHKGTGKSGFYFWIKTQYIIALSLSEDDKTVSEQYFRDFIRELEEAEYVGIRLGRTKKNLAELLAEQERFEESHRLLNEALAALSGKEVPDSERNETKKSLKKVESLMQERGLLPKTNHE